MNWPIIWTQLVINNGQELVLKDPHTVNSGT